MLKIAFCDGERHFISYLENQILKLVGQDEELRFWEAHNGAEFSEKLERLPEPDILFLNAELPETAETSGSIPAMEFRRKCPFAVLILCFDLQFPDPGLLEARPYCYLSKQYSDRQTEKELEEIFIHLRRLRSCPAVWGCHEKTHYRLSPDDILYISKAKRGCIVHLAPKSLPFQIAAEMSDRLRLQELYARLRSYEFAYAHNSYIVNLKYVVKCSRTELQLSNGHILTISRSKRKEFEDCFYHYYAADLLIRRENSPLIYKNDA